jgi:hypothetical protein
MGVTEGPAGRSARTGGFIQKRRAGEADLAGDVPLRMNATLTDGRAGDRRAGGGA